MLATPTGKATSLRFSKKLLQWKYVYTKFGVMKVLAVLTVLTAVLLCIRAAPAPCSSCNSAPVPSTGPCAYCLQPMNTSEDGGMRTLFYTFFNTYTELQTICGDDCKARSTVIDFSTVSAVVDVHNDRVNGQLEGFLILQKQANGTCGTQPVTENPTLLNVCKNIQNKLGLYIQSTRDYLENQKCGCPGHDQCCYEPTFQITYDVDNRSLQELIVDVYTQAVLTGNILRKIKHLDDPDWNIPEQYISTDA